MKFMLDGVEHELTPDQVRDRLIDVLPGRVRHHGVRVDRRVFPVKQAFEVALGRPRSEFTTQTAREHLAALGFELVGEVEPKDSDAGQPGDESRQRPAEPAGKWPTEGSVQATLVAYLEGEGWRIAAVADTQKRDVDVVAERDGHTLAVEVKGYPTRSSDPSRSSDRHPAQPSTQAVHWYARAVLSAMRTRSRLPQARAVIALPDVETYRELQAETADSLHRRGLVLWWITQDGDVLVGTSPPPS